MDLFVGDGTTAIIGREQDKIKADNVVRQRRMIEIMLFLLGDDQVYLSKMQIEQIFSEDIMRASLKNYYWRGLLYLKLGEEKKGLEDLKVVAELGRDYWDARVAREILKERKIQFEEKEPVFSCRMWNCYKWLPIIFLGTSLCIIIS